MNMLQHLLLLLTLVPTCFMERERYSEDILSSQGSTSSSSSSSLGWPLQPSSWLLEREGAIEVVGPRDFQALSGDLIFWTRLSPLVLNLTNAVASSNSGSFGESTSLNHHYQTFNSSTSSSSSSSSSKSSSTLSLQLFLLSTQRDGKDGKEIIVKQTFLGTQLIPQSLSTAWEKVAFPCNLVVHGGTYLVHLVYYSRPSGEESLDGGGSESEGDVGEERILSNLTISIRYPTIAFEVPHRIDAYTTATPVTFGFTRSTACEPRRPLPPTILVLSICSPDPIHSQASGRKKNGGGEDDPVNVNNSEDEGERDAEEGDGVGEGKARGKKSQMADFKECNRDFAIVYQNPVEALLREGRITVDVGCHLWARNATYRVQIREKGDENSTTTAYASDSNVPGVVIARSRSIRVEWGSQFSLNVSKATVMPCRSLVRVVVSYPACVLPGKDKIRVFGHESLSVPSALVPNRLSYIAEHKIQPNSRVVTFRCNLFPQRFNRFCFQYVNTAVDESVSIVMEKCIPTTKFLNSEDGNWGNWSEWTPCTVTCEQDGRQYRYRFCDNPPPSSGANFCQGAAIEERSCDTSSIPDCPPPTFVSDNLSSSSSTSFESNSLNTEDDTGSSASNNNGPQQQSHHPHPSQHRHSLHQLQLENITLTPGCECGCILYDLVPGRNDTLVIFISSNYSSPCADEDEMDHHKFRWIFHAKEEQSRIHIEVVELEVQCVTITFRDGNTTDSNLLQVINSEHEEEDDGKVQNGRGYHHHHHHDTHHRLYYDYYPSSEENGGGEDGRVEEDSVFEPLTLESTGASLSISVFDVGKNCSGQFIYFIAYYSTLTSPTANSTASSSLSLNGSVGGESSGWTQFWSFLVLKLILVFFLLVIIISGFGGCLTRSLRKQKYRELKCFDNEVEGGSGNNDDEASTSRCTSVTVMSFDYSYWRRMRLLRLKYFLLRPRTPQYIANTKVKSFPSTPTRRKSQQQQQQFLLKASAATATTSGKQDETSNKTNKLRPLSSIQSESCKYKMNKSISLSETNLRGVDVSVDVESEGRKEKGIVRKQKKEDGDRSVNNNKRVGKKKQVQEEEEGEKGADGAKKSRCMIKVIYSKDPLSIGSGSRSTSASLNGSASYSYSSSSSGERTPTPTTQPHSGHHHHHHHQTTLVSVEEMKQKRKKKGNEATKVLKDAENGKERTNGKTKCSLVCRNGESCAEGLRKGRLGHSRTDNGKSSQLSIDSSTTNSSNCNLRMNPHYHYYCRDGSDSRASGRTSRGTANNSSTQETEEAEFEMDYYDYDVMNVGTIPGSYLGLEPAFVLWNSEVYQQAPDDQGDNDEGHVDEEEEEEEEEANERDRLLLLSATTTTTIPSSSSKDTNASSSSYYEDCFGGGGDGGGGSDSIEMTMTAASSSASLGIFSSSSKSKSEIGKGRKALMVRETSLDTLKFADDDDDEDEEEMELGLREKEGEGEGDSDIYEYDDDNATRPSDTKLFDNEHDLIKESQPPKKQHRLQK